MIELRQVTKKFGQRLALSELTFHVPAGEIYGLLGHNGAGKSTAIGLMLGQIWPSAGQIRICGHDVTTQRHLALRRVGAIFETPAFYDYLSGWRNLDILSHYTAPTPRSRILEVLDWVGLSGREEARVQTYSHGMRARLALAQALLPNPELLILDEPSDGLDPEGIHEMRQTVLRLRRELGLTILLSSHLLHEVQQLCTRIAVLKEGRMLFAGTLPMAGNGKRWLRLQVNDPARAFQGLRKAQLIEHEWNPDRVVPAQGVGADQIVRHLVGAGIAIYEVRPLEMTLEDFYLGLMRQPPENAGVNGGSRCPDDDEVKDS